MLKLEDLRGLFDRLAPYEISYKTIENGGYDNSGIIIRSHDEIERVLYSLDLSFDVIKRAKYLKCDTIVTHHPAIYSPIKSLDVADGVTGAVALAIENKINVISNHLNLDMTTGGIDECLCEGISGEKGKILDRLYGDYGYGREFCLEGITLGELSKKIKRTFSTKQLVVYGKKTTRLSIGASFCGGGDNHALDAVKKGLTSAEVIITSDAPHHVIKELVEMNKCLVLISHYASENYGFKKFYERVKKETSDKVESFYFEDRRFL